MKQSAKYYKINQNREVDVEIEYNLRKVEREKYSATNPVRSRFYLSLERERPAVGTRVEAAR